MIILQNSYANTFHLQQALDKIIEISVLSRL